MFFSQLCLSVYVGPFEKRTEVRAIEPNSLDGNEGAS